MSAVGERHAKHGPQVGAAQIAPEQRARQRWRAGSAMPPMVGVPAFGRCVPGPSSRTFWPIFFALQPPDQAGAEQQGNQQRGQRGHDRAHGDVGEQVETRRRSASGTRRRGTAWLASVLRARCPQPAPAPPAPCRWSGNPSPARCCRHAMPRCSGRSGQQRSPAMRRWRRSLAPRAGSARPCRTIARCRPRGPPRPFRGAWPHCPGRVRPCRRAPASARRQGLAERRWPRAPSRDWRCRCRRRA